MVEITTATKHRTEVTLVRAIVTNTRTTTQSVTIETHVDGPIWLPKRNGMAVSEWTDETWSAVLQPGESRGLGFATPGEPMDPPVAIGSTARSMQTETESKQIIGSLEEWSPPTIPSTERQ